MGVGRGVVDEDVEATELALRRRDEALDVFAPARMGSDGERAAAERPDLRSDRLEVGELAARDDDVGAGGGQTQRDRAADAARCPGDDGDALVEAEQVGGH